MPDESAALVRVREVFEVPLSRIDDEGDRWVADPAMVKSIAEVGQKRPVILSSQRDGQYKVKDGRRRIAAIRRLHEMTGAETWTTVDALIEKDIGHDHLTTLAGNLHSPNPLSEARAIAALNDDELAQQVGGLTKSQIAARLRLLRLADEFQAMLQAGEMTMTAAKELAKLLNQEDQHRAWDVACELAGKKPATKHVRQAVRKVRGSLQPQLAAPVPVVPASNARLGPRVAEAVLLLVDCVFKEAEREILLQAVRILRGI